LIYQTLEPAGEVCQSVDEVIYELLLRELSQGTKASQGDCQSVAKRLGDEVSRICTESKRIQNSGDVLEWATSLANHRLEQCLHYYRLGSRRGRVDLHSTLSAVVYRYISPNKSQAGYQARLTLIEDFLQGFYMESLNAFRRENQMGPLYSPRTLVSQQQPNETLVDIERAAEGSMIEDDAYNVASMQQLRDQMVAQDMEPAEDTLRQNVVQELIDYLKERKQQDCVDYFTLRLQDLPTQEIEHILGLTPRQRDYLQQRFKYHLVRFTFAHRWELVHQWLEIDLDHNLGLSTPQWEEFQGNLTEHQRELVDLKKQRRADGEIARKLGCTVNQLQKQWFKLLEQAWEIRNCQISGASPSGDE
jgi:hypothetical protein